MQLTQKQKEAIQYFKLGKIKEAIVCFENSINENINSELVYESLGICYMELCEYEKSIKNFNKVINLNIKNERSIHSILNLLNLIEPINFKENFILNINKKILSLNKILLNKISSNLIIKDILTKAESYVDKNLNEISYKETQIFRRNNYKLDCDRHFKVFNKFKVIPKFCFNCYKIQISLEDVAELVKTYFLFNQSFIKKSNLRKCMIETRSGVEGNYKAFIYFDNLEDPVDALDTLKEKIIENQIRTKKIEIKHGCSEFYSEYPDFKKINFQGKQSFNYKDEWKQYEKIIDNQIFKTEKNNLFSGTTLNLLTLPDFFIIKNWINYAKSINDNSYKKIF